jgi:hypothetical protein
VYGQVKLTFNDGNPVVVDEVPNPAYAFLAARNRGPQNGQQAFMFGLSADYGAAPEPVYYSAFEYEMNAGEIRQFAVRLGEILANETGKVDSINGLLLAGDRAFVAGNRSTAPDTFHPYVHAFEYTGGVDPWKLGATLDLAPSATGSTEVTSLSYADLPTNTVGDGASLMATITRKIGADCHEWSVAKFTYTDVGDTRSLNLSYNLPMSFPECRTKAVRVRPQVPQPQAPIGLGYWWAGRCLETAGGAEKVCISEIVDDGSSLSLDLNFGGGDGQVTIQHAGGLNMRFWDVASQGDKLVVAAGREGNPGAYDAILIRLNANGTLDTTFGNGGVVEIPTTGLSTNPRTLSADIHGGLQVTGETYTANSVRPFVYFHPPPPPPPASAAKAYEPVLVEHTFADTPNSTFFVHERLPDGSIVAAGAAYLNYPDPASMRPLVVVLEGPPAATKAIEYVHAGFGHYAVITDPAEIQALDTGVFAGWARTGHWFNVYATEVPGSQPVDRFFSTAFAPKSSHFYTREAFELAIVQANPDWLHEGTRFHALWPNGANGRCPAGTRPVKRIYNNGVTGAPNHQYADDDAVVAAALAAGGVIENAAPDGGYFCTE